MNAKFLYLGIGLSAVVLAVVSSRLTAHQVAGSAVELFDWASWTAQQQHLIHSADALTGRLSSARRTGTALKQKLGDISHLVMPHKIIPMDQALAMLKVQNQMRSEDQEPHDRIEGAGDVAGLVDEKDEAMERDALREPAEGPDLDTSNLFENCEDGSLTAEDADLCQRRASAIKLLTKSAVNAQLAQAVAANEAPAPVQNKVSDAQKELLAEAEIGKQYLERLRLLNERKQGLSAGMERKAQRTAQALKQGSLPSSVAALAKKHGFSSTYKEQGSGGAQLQCTCKDHTAPRSGPGYMDGTSPACSCSGGEASSLVQQPLPAAASTSLPLPHRAVSPRRASPPAAATAAARTGTRAGAGAGKLIEGKAPAEGGKGDLGALADIAAAAKEAGAQRVGGGSGAEARTRAVDMDKGAAKLAGLEQQISAEEAALAAKKLKFTEELTRRQQQLQQSFLQSMHDVRAGLQLVDAVPLSSSATSSSTAAAASVLSMQQLAPLALPTVAGSAGSGAGGLEPGAPVSAVMATVQHSPLFQHPPPAAAPAPKHPSEKATLRAALDDQFAQVAAVHEGGRAREQRLADVLHRQQQQQQQQEKGRRVLRQALRLSDSLPHAAAAQPHIGPASYRALSRAAREDLRASQERQQPSLAAAAHLALAADQQAHVGAGAQLADAEAVLCTVARLKQGLCSSSRPARLRPAHPRRPTQALRLAAPPSRHMVTHPPSVATLASDVVHNMEGLFAQPG